MLFHVHPAKNWLGVWISFCRAHSQQLLNVNFNNSHGSAVCVCAALVPGAGGAREALQIFWLSVRSAENRAA
jgi:hypothetical protein